MPDFVKRDTDLASSKPDAQKSLKTKRSWGRNMRSFLSGIKKFHNSPEGRRLHRKLGRLLATKNLLPKLDHNRSLLSLRQELKPETLMGERIQLKDQFEINGNWTVSEISESVIDAGQKSIVDGKNVLARVSGPFFLVNGISSNRRFYSRRLWENALGKMKKVLEKGGALGTVGHDQEIDEKAILEGKISHIVTKLWIDDSDPSRPVGMGEALILGTPSGMTLNALFRAGIKIPVSSRAFGSYRGKGPSGEDIIDEDSFEPQTFDFVLSPGVETAFPTIKESRKEEVLETGEETIMDPTTQKLNEERLALQADLNEAHKVNEQLSRDLQKANESLTTLRKIAENYKKVVGSPEQARALDESLRKFLELEPLKTWFADMDGLSLLGGESGVRKLLTVTEAYVKTGSNPAEVRALKEKAGSVQDVEKLMAVAESYLKAGGSPKQVAENAKLVAAYKELGAVADIKKVFAVAEQYFNIGSPKQIVEKLQAAKKALVESKKLAEAKKAEQKRNVAKKIAEAFDEDVEYIAEQLKTMKAEKVIEIHKKRAEQKGVQRRYAVTESAPTVKGKLPSGPKNLVDKLFEDMR